MKKTTTLVFIIVLAVLAVIHLVSLKFYLYWNFLWLDIFVHCFAGVIVALGAFAVFDFFPNLPTRWLGFWPIIAWVLIVGLVWEVFELLGGGIMIEANFKVDLITDLIMDVVGGVIGFFIGRGIKHI